MPHIIIMPTGTIGREPARRAGTWWVNRMRVSVERRRSGGEPRRHLAAGDTLV